MATTSSEQAFPVGTLGDTLKSPDLPPYFCGKTVDDLTRHVIEAIFAHGAKITATKGPNTELLGAVLKLTNPRARLSRTETRGKLFSALGELCWYLNGTDRLEPIEYYISKYRKYSNEAGILTGAYGPRLFCWDNVNQFHNIKNLLGEKSHTRQAVIQLFSRHDVTYDLKDVACTCTLQFLIRSGRLNLVVHMRSNDAFVGLSHDIFCFTMLQEIMACSLEVELGSYIHLVGSLHLYDENVDAARRFLSEGWQPTDQSMPSMPKRDLWPSIGQLLQAERRIRKGDVQGMSELDNCNSYWKDLGRLLLVFRSSKDGDVDRVRIVRDQMSADYYRPFIDRRITTIK